MNKIRVALPIVGLIAGTRAMLGIGLGLLLAGKFDRHRRVVTGSVLLALGVLSTIPLAVTVVSARRASQTNPAE